MARNNNRLYRQLELSGLILEQFARLASARQQQTIPIFDIRIDFPDYKSEQTNEEIINDVIEQSINSSIDNATRRDSNRVIDVNITKYDKNDSDFCSICRNDFESDNSVVVLPCKHIFHPDCIKEWGRYKPKCPICRSDIPIKPKPVINDDEYEHIEF